MLAAARRCDESVGALEEAFATADVAIVGWRLSTLSDHLRDGDLLVVRSRPARYVHLEPKRTFVAEIKINPLKSAS